jgi:hypothetical protein
MTDAHRVWDSTYTEAIYVDGTAAGGLNLTLPDGSIFEVGPEQARELRKALQRNERRAQAKVTAQ